MKKNENKNGNSKDKEQFNDSARDQRDSSSRNGKSSKNSKTNANKKNGSRKAGTTVYSSNHPSWYIPDSNLLGDVASIPFNYRLGSDVDLRLGKHSSNMDVRATVDIPGLCEIKYQPVYGVAADPTAAINVAAQGVYSFVRHKNSGARNYDAADQMTYLIAMDSVYSAVSWMKRLYAIAGLYSIQNSYLPKALVNAIGVDFEELVADQAQFRARLDNAILKASTLCVPNTFPLYTRHVFMNTNIYVDSTDPKGQMYFFNPEFLYERKYVEGMAGLYPVDWRNWNASKVARVTMEASASWIKSWKYYMNILDSMLEQIFADEDVKMISGDIERAYDSANLYKMETLAADTYLTPVYDPAMLTQIHNAIAIGSPEAASLPITQVVVDTGDHTFGYLNAQPRFATGGSSNNVVFIPNGTQEYLLDYPIGVAVNEETNVVATRLNPGTVTGVVNGEYFFITPKHAGSEVCTQFRLFEFDEEKVMTSVPFTYYLMLWENEYRPTRLIQAMAMLQHIAHHPPVLFGNEDDMSDEVAYRYFGETNNFTRISSTVVDHINDMALLGLFNVPRLTLQTSSNA